MEEYREAQREKWLRAQQEKQTQQQATGSSAGSSGSTSSGSKPSSASASGTGSSQGAASGSNASAWDNTAAPTSSDASVPQEKLGAKRVHILPVGDAGQNIPAASRLDMIAPELKKKRNQKEPIKEGLFIRSDNGEFIVVKAEPEECVLSTETDYYTEGDPIPRLDKVHFICLWDYDSSAAPEDPKVLFNDFIRPHFNNQAEPGQEVGTIVTTGQTVKIKELDFQVVATEPSFPPYIGVIDTNTMVYVNVDTTPEFDKIHIVPFQDTLPHAYEFDVFNDYLKPYLTRDGNKHVKFVVNDQFTYQGVQFKVVCCEPAGPARIGRNTTIYCEGVLHPSLRNLLPPELLEQLAQLPQGLQMLLLNTDAFAGDYQDRLIEVQEMLSRRRGLSQETIQRVDKFRWDEGENSEAQTQCMVCLSNFANGEEVRRLPCGHVFHAPCIDEWLKRCTDCPICKANVDRAVRHY